MDQASKPSKELPPGCTIIAMPYVSKQGFTAGTMQSITLGILSGGLKMCKFLWIGDMSQVGARNAACEDALRENFEWLFFVDSDMDFPTDTLARLKACNADIACTDMWSRNIPSFRTVMVLGDKDERGMSQSRPVSDEIAAKKQVVDVDLCGMACTLIRTSLLKKMEKPYFWTAEHGEDATFCFKAKDLGASIKCDFGITAGHWGVARMAGQDFTRDARNQMMTIANMEMMRRMDVRNLPEKERTVA